MSTVSRPPRAFVNTYVPLVASAEGREAAIRFALPAFIDGSIRREPDLQHDWPSISCLCRAGKFAPRLRVGDHVAYLARKSRYGGHGSGREDLPRHWRLSAVLRVHELFDSHEEAAGWYAARRLPPPSNCMVDGNVPLPLERSHMKSKDRRRVPVERLQRVWDAGYQRRARLHPRFVVCAAAFRELSWRAPVVHEEHLVRAFGSVPGTQNPAALPMDGLHRLINLLGLPALPPLP